jgi:hypothetical protein
VSKRSHAAGDAENPWGNGRLPRTRAAAADTTDQHYGVNKPDVIEDFLRERALDGLFDDRDGECPCGSGKSYWGCHGKPVES